MSQKKLLIVLVIIFLIGASVTLGFLRSSRAPIISEPAIQATTTIQVPNTTTTSNPTPSSQQHQSPRSYEYDVNLPHALMLVDPQGRRTGKDPITGVFYREIPGTGYGGAEHSGQLVVSGLPDGRYTLYVLGGVTGLYWVDAWPPQKITGNIKAGAMDSYIVTYSSTNTDNPKLIFQSTSSSTVSVASAPPNNLPL